MNHQLSAQETTAVQDILIRQLQVERIQLTPDARVMADLGADSLDIVEIGMMLEERFSFSIPDEKWDEVETVAELCEAVAGLIEQP